MKNFLLFVYVVSFVLLGVYSINIPTNNSEEIYLTKSRLKKEHEFNEKYEAKEYLALLGEAPKELNSLCEDLSCEFVTHNQIRPESKSKYTIVSSTSKENLQQLVSSLPEELTLSGSVVINDELNQQSLFIGKVVFPIFFGLVFFLIFALIKDVIISAITFFPSLLSVFLSLSLVKVLFGELNLISQITPILQFTLNLCLSFHLLAIRQKGNSWTSAIQLKKRPIILMAMTTAIGFGSLISSKLEVIQQFGMVNSIIILISTITSVLWFYLISDFNTRSFSLPEVKLNNFIPKKKIMNYFIPPVILLSIFSINQIPKKLIGLEYFPHSSKVYQDTVKTSEVLGGFPILTISLKNSKGLNELDFFHHGLSIENDLQQLFPQLKFISQSSLVREANRIYSKENKLPENMIAYGALLSKVPEALVGILSNEKRYNISVLSPPLTTKNYKNIIDQIKAKLNDHYLFYGNYYWLFKSQSQMTTTLMKSLLISLGTILFVFILLYRNSRKVFKFTLANTLPIFIVLAIYPLIGLSFNIATIMTFSISLGIIVDASIHLNEESNHQYKHFNEVVQSISLSASILSLCFICLSFINFIPIREFALSMLCLTLVACFVDLWIYQKDYS